MRVMEGYTGKRNSTVYVKTLLYGLQEIEADNV